MGLDDAEAKQVRRWIGNGQYRKARRHVEQRLARDPDDPRALALLVSARVGLNESAEALAIAEDAIARFPEAARAHASLGYVHLIRFEIDDAQRALERALELDPTLAPAAQNLGVVHMHRKDGPAAEQAVLDALQHQPDNGDLLGALADIRWQRGDSEGARRARREQLRATRSPIVVKQMIWTSKFWAQTKWWLWAGVVVIMSIAGIFVPALERVSDVLLTLGFAALFALLLVLLLAEIEEYFRRRIDFSLSETITYAVVLVLLPLLRFTDFPWFDDGAVPPPPVVEEGEP